MRYLEVRSSCFKLNLKITGFILLKNLISNFKVTLNNIYKLCYYKNATKNFINSRINKAIQFFDLFINNV